jgi:hypothetical protein
MEKTITCSSHVLPLRALSLIREYSKPFTRADWRNSIPVVSSYGIYLHTRPLIFQTVPIKLTFYYLCKIIMRNIMQTEWYSLYIVIQHIGIYNASLQYNFPYKKISQIEGLLEADKYHKKYKN